MHLAAHLARAANDIGAALAAVLGRKKKETSGIGGEEDGDKALHTLQHSVNEF